MSGIKSINPNADVLRRGQAIQVMVNAALGLQSVVRSNLGPMGTLKMLVNASGDIKLTKDGKVLLSEMSFQNPTASMIAKAVVAQDDVTGDGTTSNVLLIGELLKQGYRYVSEGLHPRLIARGFEIAREQALKVLEECKRPLETPVNRETLINVARTSLGTKITCEVLECLAKIVVDAILTINNPEHPLDLHMIEIIKMQHSECTNTRLVRGLVLDHGARHADMPKRLTNVYILILNVSLEYEKTEINSGFFYSSARQRNMLISSERLHIDRKLERIIELKDLVCGSDRSRSFMVVNQKGIDPLSLDVLAKNGILALRRAKRRNMERLQLACGGTAQNSVDDLSRSVLGYAPLVYEQSKGDDRYTFIEGIQNPLSVTILIKGPSQQALQQISEAIRDGLRAVKNVLDDRSVVPGAGVVQVMLYNRLNEFKDQVEGKVKLGVQAFAEAMLIIPKVLAQNSGLDVQEAVVMLTSEVLKGRMIGLDISTGLPIDPVAEGILDNYKVHRHLINSSSTIAANMFLVDEMMRAGKSSLKNESNGGSVQ